MTILDSEYDTNVRAIIEITNITRYGFELILKTFNNTKQWGLKASWMACPAR
ncbi:hypothetical protein FSP39_014828 [Pinctada imbricata]|uniref:H-type lectin domain-containing protein n=1 Tax=Pinctada imbricata TaxID=66713 RepID=A0AA88YD89_PINIB|nr:hypothetical protein FSP39_014828 [Pinctada imbricata]